MLLLHDLNALVTEHRGWLLRLCERRLGGDRHLAEDVVQETFVKLSRALARGDEITNVRGWLRTVAQHGTVDELRRSRSIVVDELPESPVHEAVAGDGDPELETAWNGLNPRHREVLRLRELEGLRYDEIADAMATGVPAIETLLFRARAALRREYSRAAAAVSITPAPVAIGRLRPSRWASLWHGGGSAARTVTDVVTARVAEVAAALGVGGVAVASLLTPSAIPDVPDVGVVVPLPAVETIVDVPVEPALPSVTVPPVPTTPPTTAPPAPVADVVAPVATVVDDVVSLVEPVLEEIAALTARLG